jgi:ATP/maltotriose-dependent transcriptional regulator MalT
MENHQFAFLALQRMGEAKWHLGEASLALDLMDQAVETARAYGMASFEANALMVKGRALREAGRDQESLSILRNALNLAGRLGNVIIKLEASLLAAELLLESGDGDTAREMAKDASTLCATVKHRELVERTEALFRRLGLPFEADGSEPAG